MKYKILIVLFLNFCWLQTAEAQTFRVVTYKPLTKEQCQANRKKLGLKYCNLEEDHFAGAAKACGGVENLPTDCDLWRLARHYYKNLEHEVSSELYGPRNDAEMKKNRIWIKKKYSYLKADQSAINKIEKVNRVYHLKRKTDEPIIFYWAGEEIDEEVGYGRVFAPNYSEETYVPRGIGSAHQYSVCVCAGRQKYYDLEKALLERKKEQEQNPESEIVFKSMKTLCYEGVHGRCSRHTPRTDIKQIERYDAYSPIKSRDVDFDTNFYIRPKALY